MPEKKLNLFAVTSLTLLNIAGTGIFFGPALSAREAGTAALLVWVWIGLQSVYIGMMFSELVSMMPQSGGVYEYAKQAYGRFASFMTGWCMWLVSTAMTAMLILSALLYAFPGLTTTAVMAASLSILAILSFIAYRGLGASEMILDLFAAIVLIFIALAVILGVSHVEPTHFQPLLTATPLMLFVALFFILETYFGWEAVTFMAEETAQPEKTIPRALMIATITVSVLGIGFAIVMFGVFGANSLSQSATPLLDLFRILFGDTGGLVLRAGVFLSLVGSAAGMIISGPRLLQAMARDKLFIEQLGQKSARTHTPARAIFFQAIVAGAVLWASLGNYERLLSMVVPLSMFVYVVTFLAVPVLRVKKPGPRPFNCPLPHIGPIIVSCVFIAALAGWLITQPGAVGIFRFVLSLLGFGIPIYLLLSTYYNPSTQLFFADALAYPALWLENFIVPKRIRKKMLDIHGSLEGKTVLELGAGVGSFTLDLSRAVTSKGRVVAVEAGKTNVDVLLKRISIEEHQHVKAIHDVHATNRLHPDIGNVDAVFSLGMLGYLQDTQRLLDEIADVLAEHGTICFVEWMDYFGIIPNPHYLSNLGKLKREFEEAGFSIRIEKVDGLFWNYLVVHGLKTSEKVPYA